MEWRLRAVATPQKPAFGATAHDPMTFIAVVGLLTLVSIFAVLIPAFRATTVNPIVALRKD